MSAGIITEYGWEPGADRVFYVLTSDGKKHLIPESLMRGHFDAIDIRRPYPFADDAAGNAISAIPN